MSVFVPTAQTPYAVSAFPTSRVCSAAPSQEPSFVSPTPSRVSVRKAIEVSTVRLRNLLLEMTATSPSNPGHLLRLEEQIHARVRAECLDPVVAEVLVTAHSAPEVKKRAERFIRWVPDLVAQKKRQLVQITLLGGTTVSLCTPYYLRRPHKNRPRPGRKRRRGSRRCNGNGAYPILAALGIQNRVTPAVACEVARLATVGTYQEASSTLRARGISLDAKQVGHLAKQITKRGLAYRDWCVSQTQAGFSGTGNCRGMRLGIEIDGGRMRIREPHDKGPRRKSGRRGMTATWREPKVYVIYEIDARGRKRRKGILRQDATLGDADHVFRLLVTDLRLLGAHEALEWVIVADGAEWIWNRIATMIEAVGFQTERVTQVVDFYHAVEHLSEIADNLSGQWRKDWFRKAKRLLKSGDTEGVERHIRLICRGRKGKVIAKRLTYFQDHATRMTYDRFRRWGAPIGSGAVESCIRRVVNLRFKGNSTYWRRESGEALLHARAQLLASRWQAFTANALEAECFWSEQRCP